MADGCVQQILSDRHTDRPCYIYSNSPRLMLCIAISGCLQLLEILKISQNLKFLLEILEIYWNFVMLLEKFITSSVIFVRSLKLLPPNVICSLKLKCTKFDFGWGSAPDPAGGAYSAPPDSLAVFSGAYF